VVATWRKPSAAPPVRRCAVYTRKSTEKGLELQVTSLDVQRERCEAWVRSQGPGYTILPTRYDDGGYTGANTARPAFRRLLADIEAGLIDVVVIYKLDRLSRSMIDYTKLLEYLQARGVDYVSVTENFRTTDAAGEFQAFMQMSVAQYERRLTSNRVRDNVRTKREMGKWTGGVAPLGYRIESKKLVVSAEWSPLAVDVIRLWLETRSAKKTARVLNAKGRYRPSRLLRDGTPVKLRPWRANDVLALVKCPWYGGFVLSGEELHRGDQPPLIDEATFALVQARLEEVGSVRAQPGRRPIYMLSGLLRCGNCGKAMTGASTRNRHGTVYRYYRCTTRDQRGAEACSTRQCSADVTESYVVAQVRDEVRFAGLATRVPAAVEAAAAASRRAVVEEENSLARLIEAKTAERSETIDAYVAADGAARRGLEERMNLLEQDLRVAGERQRQLMQKLVRYAAATKAAADVGAILADFDRSWELLNVENRARVLRSVVSLLETKGPGKPLLIRFDAGVCDDLAGVDTQDRPQGRGRAPHD
jgi:site-specific DNA recombinase